MSVIIILQTYGRGFLLKTYLKKLRIPIAIAILAAGLAWIWFSRIPEGSGRSSSTKAAQVGFSAPNFQLPSLDSHVIELNELRSDTLQSWNILVLCPSCHRKMHYADVKYEYLNNKWKIIMEEKEIIIE